MSIARKRRRWRKWNRYVDYCCRFGERIASTGGVYRSYNQQADDFNNRQRRGDIQRGAL